MEEGDQPIEEIPEEEEKEEEGEEQEEGEAFSPRQQPPKKKPCNQRIDELATPNKRIFLALWNEHAYHFPKNKVNYLKHLLQKLYALSPEETAKYFTELRSEARAAEMRRNLKSKLRKYLLARYQQKQRQRAFNLFKRLLKCGISYSARNPVPPLVSIRLRYLADVILEQLCALRKVDIPNRANPDKLGEFLVAVSDWIAIAVERLFFAAQVAINQLTGEEPEQSMEVPSKYEDFAPGGASTPQRLSLQDGMQVPKTYAEMGHPAASSTPYQISMDKSQTVKAPPTYSGMGYPVAASTPRRPSGPIASSTPYQISMDKSQTVKAPPTYSGMGSPVGASTPRRPPGPIASSTPYQISMDKSQTVKAPPTYSGMGSPVGASTPRRPPGPIASSSPYQISKDKSQTVKAPPTYSGMGSPVGASTPRRSSGPIASSSPYQKTSKSDVDQGVTSSTFGTLSYDETENQGQQLSDRPSLNPYYSFVAPVATSTPKKILPSVIPSYNYKTIKYPPGAGAILAKSQFEVPYGFERVPKRGAAKNSKEFTSKRRRKREK